MKRTLVLSAILVLVAAVGLTRLLGVWGKSAAAPVAATGSAAPASAKAPVQAPAASGGGTRLPDIEHDDDPAGTIRLEGQVIDEHDQPVAGAHVGIDANPPKVVDTDASGSFAFEGLIARDYRVEAMSDKGYAGPARVRLALKPEPLTLRLVPGGTVEVVVTEAGGATPIADANVELRSTVTWKAHTDAKGVATLPHVGAVWAPLVANASGFAPAAMMLGTTGDPAAPVRVGLALSRGAAVAGKVVDEAGKPVGGARVVATLASEPFPVVDARRDGVESKPDGSFELPVLSAGTWRLSATHSTFAPVTSSPIVLDGKTKKSDVKLVLTTGAVVTGKVVDTRGAPVASADVRVVARGYVFWRAQRQAFSGADGTFTIAGLPRRSVDAVAAHGTGSSAIVPVDLETTAKATITLKLDVTGAIAGTVVDPSGAPIGDAQVTAEAEPTGRTEELEVWTVRGPQETVSDQGGAFAFTGLPPGAYRLRASRPGANEAEQWLANPTTAHPGDAHVKLVVANDGSIKGKVAFADGKVPLSFNVTLGGSYATPFATADGSFTMKSVAGTHTLVVDGKNFVAAKAKDVTVTEGKVTDVGTITVQAGRSISGRVLDQSGAPVAGAQVAAGALLSGGGSELYIPDESIGAKDTTSEADGSYRIDGFGPGAVMVVAGKAKLGRSASVRIPMGPDSATLDLVLAPTTGLDGKVTRDGKPLGDTVIIANPFGGTGQNFFVVTGADGTFAFDALAPGSYLVYPMIGGGGPKPKDMFVVRVEVIAGATAHVTIDTTPGTGTIDFTAKTTDGKPVAMAQLFVIQATITAHSMADMRDLDQLGAFNDKPIVVYMRGIVDGALEITGVRPGDYTACAALMDGRFRMPQLDDPGTMKVTCVPVKVATGKVNVAMTLPAPTAK